MSNTALGEPSAALGGEMEASTGTIHTSIELAREGDWTVEPRVSLLTLGVSEQLGARRHRGVLRQGARRSRPSLRLLPHQLHRRRGRRQPAPLCPKYLGRLQGRARERGGIVAARSKKSDFEMGPGTQRAYQHDARRQRDGTITIFDNGAHPKVHDQSRGIVVELDEEKMSARQLREYTSPKKPLATSQGNMQRRLTRTRRPSDDSPT